MHLLRAVYLRRQGEYNELYTSLGLVAFSAGELRSVCITRCREFHVSCLAGKDNNATSRN